MSDYEHRPLPKPEGSTWTDEQWEAIRLRGSDILVAAAAGSGKTAVLVERIIRRITDERQPVDVDRLLVATFTNAAAGEMRQRIREAIERKLVEQPDSEHLRRQATLIHRASITTLHSFCLDVIRRHHQRIGLDPGFRIANETEAELLRHDLLSELLEEEYGETDAEGMFWKLADMFGGERGDDALFRLIQRLYDYARSHPWPEQWLRTAASHFALAGNSTEGGVAGGEPLLLSLLGDVRLELQGIASLLEEAGRLCTAPGGPAPYAANVQDDQIQVEETLRACGVSWEALHKAVRAASFTKLNACRGADVDKQLQERVKQLRDRAKKQFNALREELFERSPAEFAKEMEELAPVMDKLAELVISFGERYRVRKAEKGLVDFSDLEHYALAILRRQDCPDGQLLPSDQALAYQEQFVEILLDEYQDTNTVQEAIVSLIARPFPGNRFMVGDVKQSIYRFRLAEPGLFMQKYRTFGPADRDPAAGGRKIDLARNFRSRSTIIDGVNTLFRQLMSERVGEMDYDDAAQLVCGAAYPDSPDDVSIELALLDKGGAADEEERAEADGESRLEDGEEGAPDPAAARLEAEEQQMETAQLEARLIASNIRRLLGMDGQPPYQVYDKGLGSMRPVMLRDMVILLRATAHWAPVIIDELRAAGIPGYTELNAGYFSAVEVEVMMALLHLIDNPYQDIPAAAVLRSPMVGLSAEELARIRIGGRGRPFYEAVLAFAFRASEVEEEDSQVRELADKLRAFLAQLEQWRDDARQGLLSRLIWRIYRDTGYYDFVGGLPGGAQRQANLRSLYDRARQYEETSLRGLFRFLRFIERMRDSGADLGTAKALGEQENVVRIMSIHKSKGLEFPVVFVAGLGKLFNQTDLHASFLLHKELGFGPLLADPELRVARPTLPLLAIRRRMKMEMIAEELRVLYVALTRPKEKLILTGTVSSAAKASEKWSRAYQKKSLLLPAYDRAGARSYLDWIGPALVRHPDAAVLRQYAEGELFRNAHDDGPLAGDSSRWKIGFLSPWQHLEAAAAVEVQFADERMEALAQLRQVSETGAAAGDKSALERRFAWTYPYADASMLASKTTVSELKRLHERLRDLEGDRSVGGMFGLGDPRTGQTEQRVSLRPLHRRPSFLETKRVTPAERGTLYHAVMQQVPLDAPVTEEVVAATVARMVDKRLLAQEHKEAVEPQVIAAFFHTDIGQRLLRSERVYREVPFSSGWKAFNAYPGADGLKDDTVVVQGMIDCLFEEGGELVLLDYKTDAVFGDRLPLLLERYRMQVELYAGAVEDIWQLPVKEKLLYFFDGAHLVRL